MKVQSDSSGIIKGYATTAATRDNLYGTYLNPNDLVITGALKALGLNGEQKRF
jgi:thiamine biosynthesis lipoprotein ApbE